MDACGCDGFASIFDERTAEADRKRYRERGPDRTTRMLVDLVEAHGVRGASVLDVGGGIGVVDHELLKRGAAHAVLVDGSPDSLRVARALARESGRLAQIEIVEGNFVPRAAELDAADIVTLDRVICCYPDVDSLVSSSAGRARRVLGIVLPRDRVLFRIAVRLLNVGYWLRRSGYRAFAHPNAVVDALAAAAGLRLDAERTTFVWRVAVYVRDGTVANATVTAGA